MILLISTILEFNNYFLYILYQVCRQVSSKPGPVNVAQELHAAEPAGRNMWVIIFIHIYQPLIALNLRQSPILLAEKTVQFNSAPSLPSEHH